MVSVLECRCHVLQKARISQVSCLHINWLSTYHGSHYIHVIERDATFSLCTPKYSFVLTSFIWYNRWFQILTSQKILHLFPSLNCSNSDTNPQLVSSIEPSTCNDAIPKSATRILFLSSRSRFSGFKSRWLIQWKNRGNNYYSVFRCLQFASFFFFFSKSEATVQHYFDAKTDPYHIEWLWQKSRAEMICRKNRRASLGVNRPFLTK